MNKDKDHIKPLRILHLEDSSLDAELIQERLTGAGFSMQMDWASNEREFTAFLQRGGYDLILADYQLPGFDAPAALLLAKSLSPGIPFIVVSGAIGEEKAVELLKLGATDYVLKDRLIKLPLVMERAMEEVREHKARKSAEETLLRLNRELRAISDCNQTLIRAEDEERLLNDICRIICDRAGYRMAWVGYAQNDAEKSVRPMAWAGEESGYLEQARITWADTERGRGPSGRAIRTGQSVCFQDFSTDPLAAPWRESALQRGYRSSISMPLKDENATTFGILTLYSSEPNAFTQDEIRLLEELAGDLAFGITALRTREKRRQAEEELGRTAALLENVFSSIHILLAYMDTDFNFVKVNRAYAAADRQEPEFFEGKNHFDLYPYAENEKIFRQVVESGEPAYYSEKPFEYAEHPEWGVSYWDWALHPVKSAAGRVEGIVFSLLNVTDRVLARKQLEEAASYSRSLIEASLDPFVTIGADGKITDVNAATEEITGFARQDLIGTDFSEYFRDPEKAREGYQRVFREGFVRDYPLEILHRDGEGTPVVYNASVYRDKAGRVAGVFAVARDITERKRTQEKIEAQYALLNAIMNSTGDFIIFSLDRNYCYISFNENHRREMKKIWNIDIEKGTNLLECMAIPELRSLAKASIDRALRGEVFSEIQHQTDVDIYYELSWNPILQNRQAVGVTAFIRDITERKRAEETIRQLNQSLEMRVREEVARNREMDLLLIQQSRRATMGEMMQNIAHQWRQPLTSLSLILSNIQDDYEYSELTKESLEEAIEKAQTILERMSATIDDFSGFFRPDRTPTEFDIGKGVSNAIFLMEAALKNDRIELQQTMESGLLTVGYLNQFAQAVMNVLANAREAIESGGIKEGKIEIRLRRNNDNGILTVQDNGGGIPGEILSRIFDPYFSTKSKGSGIGLYMSRMIVERNLKGTIEAENSGEGARITITLPLLRSGSLEYR